MSAKRHIKPSHLKLAIIKLCNIFIKNNNKKRLKNDRFN